MTTALPVSSAWSRIPKLKAVEIQIAQLEMEPQPDSPGGLQEPLVDEDLAAVADVEQGSGLSSSRRRHEQEQRHAGERESPTGCQ